MYKYYSVYTDVCVIVFNVSRSSLCYDDASIDARTTIALSQHRPEYGLDAVRVRIGCVKPRVTVAGERPALIVDDERWVLK